MKRIAALVFDVFGTLVDWRASVVRELAAFGAERQIAADWTAFADAWRAAYVPSMDRVRRGELPWTNLDGLHRSSFDELWTRFALPPIGEDERRRCAHAWHRLDPWPDVRAGLARLRTRYVVATLSNGNVALLVDLTRHGDLRFDAILSAELFQRYKPDPQVYLGAVELLGLSASRTMLVAAHNGDLAAAAAAGLGTAFIARPTEYGPSQERDLAPGAYVDVAARDLVTLAERLGA